MKKIFAILALVGIALTGVAQNVTKAGLYDKSGKSVVVETEPVIVNVTLRVVKESYKPGIYSSYALRCLGYEPQSHTSHTNIELIDARLGLGAVEKPQPKVEPQPHVLELPFNVTSLDHKDESEQAEATAALIFSLRKSRLDLITGEVGENVFGAGLKAALDEIDSMEKRCLEMFYGSKSTTEEIHTFNITITPDKSEYCICRFNANSGVVESDDMSGVPVVLKVETAPYKDYPELHPAPTKKFFAKEVEYQIVPQSKCKLIVETKLWDAIDFASPLFGKNVKVTPTIK